MFDNWIDLNNWLDSLPKPTTIKERFWVMISNLLDDFSLIRYKIKTFTVNMGDKHGINR